MKVLPIVIVFELLIICCLSLASNNKVPSSQTVHLAPRTQLLPAKSNLLSIARILKGEQDRIAFISAIINGSTPAEGAGVGDQTKYLQGGSTTSDRIPLLSGRTIGAVNYVIRVGLGTPAHDLYLAIDTGSDLAWTQCVPCDACFEQHDPIFVPAASSSYQQISCGSPQCAQLGTSSSGTCSGSTNASAHCDYLIAYLDGSYTAGDFALEALTLAGDDHPVAAAYPFGCGHKNQGLFKGLDGIIGFSKDALAFPAQTKAAFGERFAYCMPDLFSAGAVGYMEFGEAASASGDSSTALVELSAVPFYVVELEEIGVEGNQGMIRKPGASGIRNKAMVVDSGTVITRLDRPLYEQVRNEFKEASAAVKMEEAPAGTGMGLFDACYSGITAAVQVPRINFTFVGGLAFTPPAKGSLIPVDDNGTFCLALLPLDSTSGFSILGSYHQQGHLFTFDIAHSSLSISSNPC